LSNAEGLFISLEKVLEFYGGTAIAVTSEAIDALIQLNILPVFRRPQGSFVLANDLWVLKDIACDLSRQSGRQYASSDLFGSTLPDCLVLGDQTRVELGTPDGALRPAFYSAIRNLIDIEATSRERLGRFNEPYFPPSRVITSCEETAAYVRKQVARCKDVESARAGEFANSAYYMGSKRTLAPFIVEAIHELLPNDGIVVDLMCGSGSVAGACARYWRTIASDAQQFCRCLAKVQGGGLSREVAGNLIEEVIHPARGHAQHLASDLSEYLESEDRIFHGDLGNRLKLDYKAFVRSYPMYDPEADYTRMPDAPIKERRASPKTFPYMLFTRYFANIYFGLRQCVEIDSIRFGIDQLKDDTLRDWALGALIASVSKLATGYGGHFAQPLVRDWNRVSTDQLGLIIERRARSVFHEFSIRLMNLVDESEKVLHVVETVEGPALQALSRVSEKIDDASALVYLDPPYKREEYSRYYHVLETLVDYLYPHVIGRGRIPDKARQERFRSEFFTRTESVMSLILQDTIYSILQKGWSCAWSYSDSSDANIVEILESVRARFHCQVTSLSVPYQHNAQGGHKQKAVTEYLVLLKP
jgi:adenine-specific DNA-methyltransferase